MSTRRVSLHIGAMKTGTTFVQKMLGTNRQLLAENGILYPMPWSDQVEAVRDALDLKGGSHLGSIEGRWISMVEQLEAWSGASSVLSVEFLSFAEPEQIGRIANDLKAFDIRVILGARDIGRGLPAQWQTAVRNGQTTTYREYVEGVTARRGGKPKKHFWKRQDIGAIARRWADELGAAAVTVVTVPPRGSDPGELWRRFAVALDINGLELQASSTSNESLGATGTELLRRINKQAKSMDMATWNYQHGVNRALSHKVIPQIPDGRAAMSLPPEHQEWANRESDRVIGEIVASKVGVVGDLDDLRPRFVAGAKVEWPESIPDSDLLQLSTAALAGLADQFAERKKDSMGKGRNKRQGRSE